MAFLFTVDSRDNGIVTTYSVHCNEENHKIHCEGGIYNLVQDEKGNYHFIEQNVPQWLLNREKEVSKKINDYYTPAEPILFNLNYTINGHPTDCGIKQVHKEGETHYVVCATVNDERREFPMYFDSNIGHFSFDSENIPKELKTVENDISDAIQEHHLAD